MGLSKEKNCFINRFLKEQKGNFVPYQIVNELLPNKPVDRGINQFEDILFSDTENIKY